MKWQRLMKTAPNQPLINCERIDTYTTLYWYIHKTTQNPYEHNPTTPYLTEIEKDCCFKVLTAMGSSEAMKENDYLMLKDLKLEIQENNDSATKGFAVCFWLYLQTCTSFPSILLHHQVVFFISCSPTLFLPFSCFLLLGSLLYFSSPFVVLITWVCVCFCWLNWSWIIDTLMFLYVSEFFGSLLVLCSIKGLSFVW